MPFAMKKAAANVKFVRTPLDPKSPRPTIQVYVGYPMTLDKVWGLVSKTRPYWA